MPIICRTRKEVAPGKNNKICFGADGKVLNTQVKKEINEQEKNSSNSINTMSTAKLTAYDIKLMTKLGLTLSAEDQKKYKPVQLSGLNEVLLKLGLRSPTTASANSGGNRSTKVAKILNADGGRALLNRELLKGNPKQTEKQSNIGIAKAQKKVADKKSIQKNPFNAALAKEKAKADLIAGANKKLVEYKVPKITVKASQIKSVTKLGKTLPKDKSGFLKVKSVKITRAGGKYNKK